MAENEIIKRKHNEYGSCGDCKTTPNGMADRLTKYVRGRREGRIKWLQ